MSFDREIFDEARREFLAHLREVQGHRSTTCYAYHSDFGLRADWLSAAGKDWQRARTADVEQFSAWQLRGRSARPSWPGTRRYKLLFGLLLNSGLRISEALGLKAADVRRVNGTAKSVRVIGKGDKERIVPLPEVFGQVFGFWLKDQPRGEYVFARAAGQKPVSSQAVRAYLRGMLQKAGIEKKISPHKLRHTYATNLLNAGAERVDIKALLGHESLATPQIYTNVGQERMEQVVARL